MATKTKKAEKEIVEINEREYTLKYLDVKESVLSAIGSDGNYVAIMVMAFPKYKEHRALLRSVFNNRKKDMTVLNDFAALPEKIKALQQQ